jgi:crotonobetainyl-CoA:carnitine CoA-transferase CaiB-like acyl-CoA transferase
MVSSEAVPTTPTGPLAGLRVIELASESAAYAGKLLADFGAEVLLVEPPGGHVTRHYGPYAEEAEADDRSIWFWHYNTSKLGVELDLEAADGASMFRELVGHADIVLEAEPVGRLARLGLDADALRDPDGPLVWVSVTPFGRDDPRSSEPCTDLTLVCGGGIAWNCGYDDHALSPMSSLGNQGFQTGSIWAATAALVAIAGRARSGRGQLVDVSMHAAVNVTTEQATQNWLVAGKVVQRQTGRHASHFPTEPVVHPDRDGREVHTGFPAHERKDLVALVRWIDDLEMRDAFPLVTLLEMAIESGGIDLTRLVDDELVQESYRAAREAMVVIASRLDRETFFVEGQRRGFPVGMILTPDETLIDPQMIERGFPTPLHQPQLGRDVIYPGLPIRFTGTPGRIQPAPSLAEHQDRIAGLTAPRRGRPAPKGPS